MFVFDLELKKFKPAVGVVIGEDELFSDDVKDITDLVEELVSDCCFFQSICRITKPAIPYISIR